MLFSFVSETKAPQEGLDGSCSVEVKTMTVPHVWSDPATSIARRSSEDAVARAKLEHYVHAEIPSARDPKKPSEHRAGGQITTLSSVEELSLSR